MSRKVLLLTNLISGKEQTRNRLDETILELVRRDFDVTVFPIVPREGLTTEKIISRDRFDYDAVFCCGGDGTLHHLINTLHGCDIDTVIAYLPTGSTNDFACSLYGKRSLKVRELAEAMNEDRVTAVDIGMFNDECFHYVAAFGAFTKVSYATDQNLKNTLGYLAYPISALGSLSDDLKYREHAVIEYEGGTLEGDFVLGAVSNTTSIAGIESPMIRGSDLQDELLEVTLIRASDNIGEFNETLSVMLSGKPDGNRVLSFHTRKCTIRFNRKVAWTLDGENGGRHRDIVIEVRPRKQKLYTIR